MPRGKPLPRVEHHEPSISIEQYRAHVAETDARGGLSRREQQVAQRMARLGSSAHTIRVELGGRYTVAQVQRAIGA